MNRYIALVKTFSYIYPTCWRSKSIESIRDITHRPNLGNRYMKSIHKHSHNRLLASLTLLVCALLLPPAQASVKTTDIPQPLSKALSIYKKDGIQGFITALARGSPFEGHNEIRKQVLILEKIEAYYGAYQSVDILHINTLSDSTRLIYFLVNYNKGPVFGKLITFKNGSREMITSFEFHTKAEKIFPDTLLVSH